MLRDVETHALGIGADAQTDHEVDHLEHNEGDDPAPGDGHDDADELRLQLRGVAFQQPRQTGGICGGGGRSPATGGAHQ